MNILKCRILNALAETPYTNQRNLASACDCSLGIVNRSLRDLVRDGYLTDDMALTQKAQEEFEEKAPRNAIILAAGFGMRMVPINLETPKAFLEVHGQTLIERLICQLREAGVREIHVVVGFMKEQFEYLMDEYNVNLIVNPEYDTKNNLHSLALASKHLGNSYIVPCDIWCKQNPFRRRELRSWYMVSESTKTHSQLRVNRNMELTTTPSGGNTLIGVSYILKEDAPEVCRRIREMDAQMKYDNAFWEDALYHKNQMILEARVAAAGDVVEINSYEQLRELDSGSAQLKSDTLELAASVLDVTVADITQITVLKKGMTNRSFLFTCKNRKYIMRIPGEGTDHLINRREEASVYHAICDRKICDQIVYINPENGYKITEFLEGARSCDPDNPQEVSDCMKRLRGFHALGLKVDHEFDIFQKIDFYESLWEGRPSAYRDYEKTKQRVLSLRPYIESHVTEKVLTHMDAVPDNFLFVKQENGGEEIRLIDWEYAAMQDPHVDIAMFCIYALYDRAQVEQVIDSYFVEGCPREIRIKIYCYIAACGLLWSNWCEYKRNLGVDFGEYSLRQYRYAKDYYKIVMQELEG